MRKKITVLVTTIIVLCVATSFIVLAKSNEEADESFVLTSILEDFDYPGAAMSKYWDYTYTTDASAKVVSAICEDSSRYNYDVVILDVEDSCLQAHIRLRDADELPLGDVETLFHNITVAINCTIGFKHWCYLQLTYLDMANYDVIIEALNDDDCFQISNIVESEDGKTFSVLLETTLYMICEGDTLSEIAERKMTTVNELLRLNPQITDPNLIFVNDVLKIR